MVQVINNSNQIKHLTYGGVLYPGSNEISKANIENNRGHNAFERDIKNGVIEIVDNEPETEKTGADEYPKQTKEGSPYYFLSNGNKVLGQNNALEAQKELDEDGDE